MLCVKELVELGLTSIPSNYVFQENLIHEDHRVSKVATIPIIDFSLLISGSSQQRSNIIQAVGHACLEWGFFMVINHGVPKKLREEMFMASESFFNLPKEQKREYAGNNKLFDPIRFGTSFNTKVDKTFFWRDYLKIHVHPEFNAPQNPHGFSDTLQEYCKRIRELSDELLKGVSKSLGLEENYIQKTMNLEESHQLCITNLYPPCPQPELVMGLPPHSDHGLLTILMQNELDGLQVQHNGEWVSISPLPNSFLVNIGDHMEIVSNGKYKSVLHRAVVNEKATRISIATAQGPSLDTIVSPAKELLDRENQRPLYRGVKYKEYMLLQQSSHLDGKSCLDRVRI